MASDRERDPYRDTDDFIEDVPEDAQPEREEPRRSGKERERSRQDEGMYEDDVDDLQ
ncbi:hypothetical protein AB0A70_26960 [Streptomyces morookaense]|uniref:hypothetical protein n=1 Tax=Streptomyces morookaense TaxID=1970 RepID=UPI00340CB712